MTGEKASFKIGYGWNIDCNNNNCQTNDDNITMEGAMGVTPPLIQIPPLRRLLDG